MTELPFPFTVKAKLFSTLTAHMLTSLSLFNQPLAMRTLFVVVLVLQDFDDLSVLTKTLMS